MNCIEAIREAFRGETGILSTNDVITRIYSKHPDRPWKDSTVRAHLIGLSVNDPTSRYYPYARRHAFLYALGNARYRLWNPNEDGVWVVTPDGVRKADETDADQAEVAAAETLEDVEAMAEGETPLMAMETSVSLERDLERSLVTNLSQLERGLRVYHADGLQGHQLDTDVVGRIDILAVDEQGGFVVIELKAGEADERVYGQILRYMGWVKRELAGGKPVRGIIVANSFHERAKYAMEATPNIKLVRYEVSFRFLDA